MNNNLYLHILYQFKQYRIVTKGDFIMFMIDYKELSWRCWFMTACLLTVGVAGYKIGFFLAIGVTVFQLIHFIIRKHSISAFPVQVRFWYLVLLLVALPEPLQIVYWCLPWERGHN